MASGANSGFAVPNFALTPQQQTLLYAALNSNKQAGTPAKTMAPSDFTASPTQGSVSTGTYQESPFLDNLDYEFGDSSFDFDFANESQGKMIGDLPDDSRSDSADNEGAEKRSHPDDDDDEPGNDAKRRESTDKIPKKPGRKPLTSEPTSKRKAQNRAAQRAFRERKERHLKDLETKVAELEKASENANHENTKLRAQVDKMTSEIVDWKRKYTAVSRGQSKPPSNSFGSAAVHNLGDVNFQFEFPKFGMLPGPPSNSMSYQGSTSTPNLNRISSPDSGTISPHQQGKESSKSPGAFPGLQTGDDLAKYSALFSPNSVHSASNASRASVDSGHYSLNPTATSSPSASSASNMGPSSSCGTSPEPTTQSPMGFKPLDTLTTIGEEQQQPAGFTGQDFSQFTGLDVKNFDWLSQQNGGQFDPQLFGDYREPQANILANGSLDDTFFNDALNDADFFMPYNLPVSPALPKKPDLIAQIDAANADDSGSVTHNPYTCTKLWEKLQDCPKVQSGDFDLDGLCSELQKKAKCSGGGPKVSETDFQTVVHKWLGKEPGSEAAAGRTTAA